MGERHVGLDIGSFAVRAAEVSVDAGVPTLHRFAQITLPPKAVEQGEIVDRAAVIESIKALWAKGDFKTRRVVIGLSTTDIKVRQAEVPALGPDEVRSALRYETQDVIPFAGDDSVVDFLVQERFEREGAEMLRVLVVAAPRARIDDMVNTVAAAGLEVEAVDLTSFALVRSLAPITPDGGGDVIVSVGAGLTSVVVQVGGIPQMMRTTVGGGGVITSALADQLAVPYEQAEAIKRTGMSPAVDAGAVAAVVDTQLDTLVREIAGSVDYFIAQTAQAPVRRIIVTGAGSLVPGLRDRMSAEAGLPVLPADALTNVALGRTKLSPEQLVAASTTLAAPIGLALAPCADPSTRLTALLPVQYVERAQIRRQFRIVAAAIAVLCMVLAGLWGQRTFALRASDTKVRHTSNLERAVQGRDASYAGLAAQEANLKTRSAAAASALSSDVDATALLQRITAALPADIWIRSLNVKFASGKSAGTATFSLEGTTPDSPAEFLASMRSLTSVFSSVWIGPISQADTGGRVLVQFTSQATLSPGVVSSRASTFAVPK